MTLRLPASPKTLPKKALPALGLAVLALPVTLAACGGSGGARAGSSGPGSTGSGSAPAGTPAHVLAAMTGATLQAGSARANMTVTADFAGVPGQANRSYTITATGAFDLGKQLASLDMNLGSLAGGKHLQIFVSGNTVDVHAAEVGLNTSKPWVSITASSAGNGFDYTQITQSAFSGPQLLSKLTNVSAVGNESVGGVETTHYRGSLDLSQALQALQGVQGGGSSGALTQQLGTALKGTTLPVDAWIDGQDRLRRFTFSMDLAPLIRAITAQLATGASASTLPSNFKATVGLDMTLSDFGGNVDLTPPPPDQVGPAPPNFQLPGAAQ